MDRRLRVVAVTNLFPSRSEPECGILVAPGDAPALAAAVREALARRAAGVAVPHERLVGPAVLTAAAVLSAAATSVATELHLRATQVGYRPADVKVAVAFATSPLPTRFGVVATDGGAVAFHGRIKTLPGERWGAFRHHAELDFSELYRATGERHYLDDARRFAVLAGGASWMGRTRTGHYQLYPFFNAGHFRLHDLVDHTFAKRLAAWYREGIEQCVAAGSANPYRAGVPFIWCSANLSVALATQCLLYDRMTGDGRYRAFAAARRDWLLGRNPWGTTFVTEIGGEFPTDGHLQTTHLTGRRVRGGLVDGPVAESVFCSLRGLRLREPDRLAAFQDERAVYHDDIGDYSTNEPTMDGTASALLMFALCATAR